MNYDDYLKTEYWSAVSRKVKERAGYRCQVCNSGLDLNAHHRTYEHRGNELDHLNDLICLCLRCHSIFHGKADRDRLKRHKVVPFTPPVGLEDFPFPPQTDDAEMVKLTKELLEACKTKKGGLTNSTAKALGQEQPFPRKWFKRLIGTKIPLWQYKQALIGSKRYKNPKQ